MPLPGYGLHAKDEPIHGAEAEVATGRKLRLAALGGDAAAALGASLVVSPFILAVDKAIVQNAAGSDSLLGSLRKTAAETLLRPVALLRRPELYFIWGVYSATYFAANAIDTVCESRGADPAMPKFLGATCGTSLTPTLDCARRKGKCGGVKGCASPRRTPDWDWCYLPPALPAPRRPSPLVMHLSARRRTSRHRKRSLARHAYIRHHHRAVSLCAGRLSSPNGGITHPPIGPLSTRDKPCLTSHWLSCLRPCALCSSIALPMNILCQLSVSVYVYV